MNRRTDSAPAARADTDSLLESLRRSEVVHRELLASLPVIIYCVLPDPPYAPIFVSPGTDGLGYSLDEWMEADQPLWVRILHPDDRDRVVAETEAAFAARGTVEYEYRVIAKDGSTRWMHDRGAFVLDEEGRTIWRGVMLDVTERRELQERLASLSNEDELTGLLNRRGFQRMAEQALRVEARTKRRLALLYFDVDNLKPINDRFGHAEGDRALRMVADALRRGVRKGDLVGRIGGDEFVVLAVDLFAAGDGSRLGERLTEGLARDTEQAGLPYRLGFSVGVAEETGAAEFGVLIETADRALLARKARRTSG